MTGVALTAGIRLGLQKGQAENKYKKQRVNLQKEGMYYGMASLQLFGGGQKTGL